MVNLFHIPKAIQDDFEKQYHSWKNNPKENKQPQFQVAKLHFPLQLVMGKTGLQNYGGLYSTPLTKEQADTLQCYPDRDLTRDGVMIYDHNLGDGQSKNMQKKHKGNKQMRVAPCASLRQVTDFAATLQNGASISRTDISTIRKATFQAAVDRQLLDEFEESENRTPEEWRRILSRKDVELTNRDTEIANLQMEKESLIQQLEQARYASDEAKIATDKYRKKSKRAQSQYEAAVEEIKDGEDKTIKQFKQLLAESGGLSRLTIFNDRWHENHPTAAKLLWGYNNWEETKLYVDAFFEGEVDVADDPIHEITFLKDGTMKLPNLSPFEQCMLCRLYFHCFSQQQLIGLCFARHRTRIGQILKVWAPKWANIGDDLSHLDITADYLSKEVPNKNLELNRGKAVYPDGKDWHMGTKRNDTAVAKSTYSSKNDEDAFRSVCMSTATGLVFEPSPAFAGRAGERQIIRYMSSLGPLNANTEDWEDVALYDPWIPSKDDKFYTALDDALKPDEFDDILKEIMEKSPTLINGALDDGVLLTCSPNALLDGGMSFAEAESDNESDLDDQDDDDDGENQPRRGRDIFCLNDAFKSFDNMVACYEVDKDQRENGKRKRAPILTVETLKEQADKKLREGPNKSGKRKLRQLEVHQRLHLLYESGCLRKTALSFFLLATESDRLKLLSWMGSSYADNIPKPNLEDLPKIPLRYAKIPADYIVGADKGFTDIKWDMPNLNEEETPVKLQNSKTHRLSTEQIISEVPLTSCRATCETVFDRVQEEGIMHEKVPYWIIPYIPHGHAVAFGHANLFKPLRLPGKNSIVGDDYWDNKTEYTRIEQPTQPHVDVEVCMNRTCNRCQRGGINRICRTCKKFYCITCHDFENCSSDPNNPYI
jgi:hypothetical protein